MKRLFLGLAIVFLSSCYEEAWAATRTRIIMWEEMLVCLRGGERRRNVTSMHRQTARNGE